MPIFRQGGPIGVVGCGRREVKPFTATQIELLETFADQAAIAIENVRLFNELETRNRDVSEALDQQTATAEVLQVINSSPGNLAPVFDAMLGKAMRLCEATCGYLLRYQDGNYFLAAGLGLPAELEEYLAHMDQPRSGEGNARVLQGEPYIHLLDLKDDEAYRSGAPLRRAAVDLGGLRTGLLVPLRKDGELLGIFSLGRHEVRAFTDKQITLVQNFAAISPRYSTRSWRRRTAFAVSRRAAWSFTTASVSVRLPSADCRTPLPICCGRDTRLPITRRRAH